MIIKVIYSEAMRAPAQGYSPSAAKPAKVMDAWRELWPGLDERAPTPVRIEDLCRAHDPDYVDDVLAMRTPNGFGTKSLEVNASLPYTNGAMLTAARWFQHEEKTGGAMLFVLQNRATAQFLAELGGPEALAAQIEALLGLQPDDGVEWRKSCVSVRAPNVEALSRDDWWVSYFYIEQSKASDRGVDGVRYDVALVLKPEKFRSPIDAERIRARYKEIDKRFAGSSSRACRAVLARGLPEGEVLSLLQRHYKMLSVG